MARNYEMVCIGDRILGKKKTPIQRWIGLGQDGQLDSSGTLFSFKRKLDGAFVGAVFTFEEDDNGTLKGYKFSRRWPVEKDILEWQLKERLARESYNTDLALKRIGDQADVLGEHLLHIRRAMAWLPRRDRQALILWIARFLEGDE